MQDSKDFTTGTFRSGSNGDKLDTSSVISFIPSPRMQHLLSQTWADSSGWPQSANHNHNYIAQYQGINMNDTVQNTQQDFVPFDDSGGFYNDEDDGALGLEAQFSGPNDQLRAGLRGLNQANVTHGASIELPYLVNDAPRCESQQKSSMTANDRAAELRAKLIAQQRASITPTLPRPQAKPKVEPSQNSIGSPFQAVGKKVQYCQNPMSSDNQANATNKIKDKVSEQTPNPTGQGTSDADIDVLIAHGKAFADSGKTLNDNDTAKHTINNQSNNTRKQLFNHEAELPAAIHDTVRQGSNNSVGSSGASEIGEIKEDTVKASPPHQLPRPSSHELSLELNNEAALSTSSPSKTTVNPKHVPSAFHKDFEAKRARDQNMRMPITSRQTEQNTNDNFVQRPAHKSGIYQSTPPSQSDSSRNCRDLSHSSRDWPEDKVKTSAHNSFLPTDERYDTSFNARAHGGGIEQENLDRIDRTRTQHKPISRLESNRSAAERSHDIEEESSTEINGHSDAIRGARRITATEKAPILSDRSLITTGTTKADELLSIESPDSVAGIDPSIFVNRQTYEDVCDWLKITGYFNVPHRTKRLDIHRKKRALEVQREELEREEQLELEQHSRSLRASSAYPLMGFEPAPSASIFSPKAFKPSISNMPPPPLPSKDDMGIKIKDSANLEAISTLKSGVMDPRNKQPADHCSNTASVTKRQRPQDIEIRPDGPIDKMRRLDLESFEKGKKSLRSPIMKDESLESRRSRNNEPRSAGYRRRSRSLERRRRSLSPPQRRASDTGGYNGYLRNTSRVDIYSPKSSRHVSPTRRNSDSRDPPAHRGPMTSGNEYEARIHDERGSYYQYQTPHNYGGRGRGRTNFASCRNGLKAYNGRGGGQGSSIDSQRSNLQEGMQPHD